MLNLLRELFLIAITVSIEIGDGGHNEYGWLFVFIYSFSNLPVVLIYLIGFSTGTESEVNRKSTLLEAARSSNSSSRSRRETELSVSHSSNG